MTIIQSVVAAALLCTVTAGCVSTAKQSPSQTPSNVVADSAKAAVTNVVSEKATASNPLLSTISNQLGLTPTQAEGGLSSILGFAQSQMNDNQFAQVSQGIPGVDALLAAAPDFANIVGNNNDNGSLSGLLNTVNQGNKMMALVSSFQQHGLSADLIQPMVEIVLDYLGNNKEPSSELSQLASLFKF